MILEYGLVCDKLGKEGLLISYNKNYNNINEKFPSK